jgi:hypothetical protein
MFWLYCDKDLYIIKTILYFMSRKSININKNIYNKVKRCKIKDTEYFSEVITRLLDKYEKELI